MRVERILPLKRRMKCQAAVLAVFAILFAVPAAQGQLPTEEQTVITVARNATPSVVSVSRRGGSGSGVIIRSDGVVLTNAHVVGNARTVEIRTADGQTFTGTVLGRDTSIDIAVVRVDARNLPSSPLANSDELQVGQVAIAIGNPLGLDRTVTRGVVSAVNRDPRGVGIATGLIQTDAAINPGNSGGPLLDSAGRVMGINTAMLAGTTGLGFAIPINVAVDAVDQILATGRVRRAYLGIASRVIEPEVARRFNLPVESGLVVTLVERNSPADRAGLRVQDFIVGFGGERIRHSGDLPRLLRARRPGDRVTIEIVREGQPATLTAQLGEAST